MFGRLIDIFVAATRAIHHDDFVGGHFGRDFGNVRDGMRDRKTSSGESLGMHIGIGSGPVVAGVIGVKKFIYDLWGNTVNIASRLTSEASTGGILVDVATYNRLRASYRFEGPEPLLVKGQGPLTSYRLIGKLDTTTSDGLQQTPPAAIVA